jgi:hypothetical protein
LNATQYAIISKKNISILIIPYLIFQTFQTLAALRMIVLLIQLDQKLMEW